MLSAQVLGRRGAVVIVALVASAASLASSSTSLAATVKVVTNADTGAKWVQYDADPGETNAPTINGSPASGSYSIQDTVNLVPEDPCSGGAGIVTCPSAGMSRVVIHAGDMNDTVTMNATAPKGTVISGADGDDVLTGGPGGDQIFGGPGGDTISGRTGNDTIDSGFGGIPPSEGCDIDFQVCYDQIDGGGGFDTLTYANRTEPLNLDFSNPGVATSIDQGGEQDKSLRVGRIIGGKESDEIIGSQRNDVLEGGPGDAPDTICGGLGVDTVDYSDKTAPVNVTLLGSIPTDVRLTSTDQQTLARARQDCRPKDEFGQLIPTKLPNGDPNPAGQRDCTADDGTANEHDCVGEDIENVTGGQSDDVLVGNDPDALDGRGPALEPHGANRLIGGPGNDVLDGRFGADILDGGADADTVTYDDARRSTGVKSSIDGAANDGSSADFDPRSDLTDQIMPDIEKLVGSPSGDTLSGDDGCNVLQGAGGNDVIKGQSNPPGCSDLLSGGDGNDDLDGGDGGDELHGDGGGDRLQGGFGGDVLDGGEGEDTVDYSDTTQAVFAVPDGVANDGPPGDGDNIADTVESLIGGSANDVLVGNGGNGTLNGGAGNDTLDGGAGSDVFAGGDGLDTASYAGRARPVSVDLAVAGGDGEPGENDSIGADVEGVAGGNGNDTILGSGGVNLLSGGPGNDTIEGRDGDDQGFGGPGNDTLDGGADRDTFGGDEGNDTVRGGAGTDGVNGGGGDDRLDGGLGNDTFTGGPGNDVAVYSGRSKDVRITLDGADNDGESGERDFVRKTVEGTSTGAGDDTINVRDGVAGNVSCGRGRDDVTADATDTIAGDCENVFRARSVCNVRGKSVTMSRKGTVRLRVTCPRAGRATVALQTAGAYKAAAKKTRKKVRLGRKTVRLKAGRAKTVTVKLSKKGRRIVKKNKRLRARATVSLKTSASAKASKRSKTLTIKAPKRKK